MSTKNSGLEPPFLYAFLRAVNLGRHNQVPMKRLLQALEGDGFPPSAFLLASGNLVFSAAEGAAKDLRGRLELLIEREFGVATTAVFRTAAELAAVVAAVPFATPAGGSVHAALWNADERVTAEARRELAAVEVAPDRLILGDDAVYLYFTATSHTSKLSNDLIERRLDVRSTVRNINTFNRLLERWPP